MNKTKKEKSFIIKVPVFTSDLILKGKDLFGGVSYEDMIKYVKTKINSYKPNQKKAIKHNRNKIQVKEIENVKFYEYNISERPCLLIQISAYNTNLYDKYVEMGKKIKLEHNHKIGSENYFILAVPNIIGIDINNYKHQWLFLIYEDPHKESKEIISTSKLFINQILNIPTSNIKLPEILEQLKRIKIIPELTLNFSSISYDESEVDVKYRAYLTNSKFKKQKEDKFKNMPFKTLEEVINDTSYEKEFQDRKFKISVGKKEYRISKKLNEANNKIKEVAEEIFNEKISITENELKESIYNKDFIVEKLTPILLNYLN